MLKIEKINKLGRVKMSRFIYMITLRTILMGRLVTGETKRKSERDTSIILERGRQNERTAWKTNREHLQPNDHQKKKRKSDWTLEIALVENTGRKAIHFLL